MTRTSASLHTWRCAGSPNHSYVESPCSTYCATCGTRITVGVSLEQIETPTTANHADYFRFNSKHVCGACAWLFSAGRGRPGNYIAARSLEYTVISLDSVVHDKRPWLDVLREIATLPPSTQVAGVMTTDVKPRLWPRVRLATVEQFGLYVHAPDYDVSEWRQFDLEECLALTRVIAQALAAGFAKASVYHGLCRDYSRTVRDPETTLKWEAQLASQRSQPYFVPALIIAGVKKEDRVDGGNITSESVGLTESGAKRRNRADPSQPRLL